MTKPWMLSLCGMAAAFSAGGLATGSFHGSVIGLGAFVALTMAIRVGAGHAEP